MVFLFGLWMCFFIVEILLDNVDIVLVVDWCVVR